MAQSSHDSITRTRPLSDEDLSLIYAYWRACNYLAAGMIYHPDERDWVWPY